MTHQEVLERFPILKPWFAGLPEELHGVYTLRELPERYLIHQKDSPLDRVGVLCEGGLRVINEFASGNAIMIEHTGPVDFIGDVTVLAGRPRVSVTIETRLPSTVLFFTRADFEFWMERDPHLVREMARKVADKLYQSSYGRGKELFYSSPRRLMEYLLRETAGTVGPVRLPATRQQMAEELGMSLKTVDRTVVKLREQGLLTVERGKLCLSPEQRARMAQTLSEEPTPSSGLGRR